MGGSASTPKGPTYLGGTAPNMGGGNVKYPNANSIPKYNAPNINWQQAALADAIANRPNQYTPWASSTWARAPNGTWQQSVSLTPQMQTLNNQYVAGASVANTGQQAALKDYNTLAGSQEYKDVMSGASLPSFDAVKANLNQRLPDGDTRREVQGALLGLADPYNKAARSQLEARLIAQGVDPNSNFARKQSQILGDQENRQLFEAIAAGGAEESRQLSDRLAVGNYNIDNALKVRSGMLADMFSRLQNPLDRATQLGGISAQNMSGLQGIKNLSAMPEFALTDHNTRAAENQLAAYQAKYASDLDRYNAQVGRYTANQNSLKDAWGLAYDKASIRNAGAASTNSAIGTGVGATASIAAAAIIA